MVSEVNEALNSRNLIENQNEQLQTSGKKFDLDSVLSEIGDFSYYQLWKYLWISLPIALSATFAVTFVVTATNLDYRCRIPECESANAPASYQTPWIQNAIPQEDGRLQNCLRYDINATLATKRLTSSKNSADTKCSSDIFDKSKVIECNDFVFKTSEHRMIQEFGIYCKQNDYKLAMVGMISNLGGSLFKPFIGILSDKLGRLTILIIGMIGNSFLGIAKAFSANYSMFIALEFIESAVGTCIFTAAFVLCAEWVSTKNRVLSCTICLLIYPLGEIFLGILAMYISSQRILLLIIYTPGLLIIFYYWLIPESIRWLLVTGRHKRALAILRDATSKQKRKQQSQNSEYILYEKCKEIINAYKNSSNNDSSNEHIESISISAVLKSRRLLIRLLYCCIVWIVCTNVFFGLTYSAAKIKGDDNKYLSFILIVFAKIPAAICTNNLLDRIGRRTTLCTGLIIAGVATIAPAILSDDQAHLMRITFFTGMLAISISLSTLFIYTAELWPTNARNTLLNFCATMGRIGAVLAPLTPLLSNIFPSLPYLTFATIAILTGLLVLLLPETLKKKLPDTIQEAIDL